MKIDDKILSYELTGNLRKLSSGEAERAEKERLYTESPAQEQENREGDAIVHLSQTTREARAIREILAVLPDVRSDVVADMKERIESGTYEVNYGAVANRLVDTLMDDFL